MANDRGDTGYVEGVEPRPTFLEARKTKKSTKLIELSDDESGIPEEAVTRENIPRKHPQSKKTVAQNLKELNSLKRQLAVPIKMQEQDRRPSAAQSIAPVAEVASAASPEVSGDRSAEVAEEDPAELRLSVNSEDEEALTAEQEEGLSLAEEVIQGEQISFFFFFN